MNAVPKKGKKVRNVAFKGYQDGSAEFLGDQIEAMVGYRKEEFNSKAIKWTDLLVDQDKADVKAVFVQALKGDKTYMREYRVRAKNGAILWIREWGQIVCDEEGKIELTSGIAMDITEENSRNYCNSAVSERPANISPSRLPTKNTEFRFSG